MCQFVSGWHGGLASLSPAQLAFWPLPLAPGHRGAALVARPLLKVLPMELVLQRYSWVGTLAAAALAALLSARIVNTVIESGISVKPALTSNRTPQELAVGQPQRADLDVDKVAKAFDVPLPKPVAQGGEVDTATARPSWDRVPVRSALHGTLVGTALVTPERYSLCQIANPDLNETLVYAIGDKYQSARIYGIEKERVLVDNEGRNEYIDNSAAGPNVGVTPIPVIASAEAGGVKQLDEGHYTIEKKVLNNALTNMSELATQARIVPSFKNGVANGFKLFSIVPDSLYSKIGVQNGDVIRKINGYEMNSPDKALEIYQKLRDANRIEIELERRGDTVHKSYSIE